MASSEDNAPILRTGDSGNMNLQKIQEINQTFKERDIKAHAKKSGSRYIDLKKAPINQEVVQLMTWEDVKKNQAIPFELKGKQLFLACVDPESKECKAVKKHFENLGYDIETYICSPEGITYAKHYYDKIVRQESVPVATTTQEGEMITNWKNVFEEYKNIFQEGTGPEMENQLNLIAIRFRASDIHFQPQEKGVSIRMRRDGQLYEVFEFSHKQYLLLSGEIKRTAGMKANVKNIPQDGDYEFIANERKISVRVSSLPSKYGESIVLRILDAQNAIVDLGTLGFAPYNEKSISDRLKKTRGLVLVTGPTGSGKTSTLYSCLNYVNQPEKKIITLEDPIEFELQNIVQSEISESEGFSFALGLRSILRQDPDIIMVGEIRDKEAAEIALQASLTGHLVLTTVHANDAISTIPRLLNMGLKPYILAAGMELVIAQRLVRKLCSSCRKPAELDPGTKQEVDDAVQKLSSHGIDVSQQQIFEPVGCKECANTGYNGRLAIAEVLEINDDIRRSILAGDAIHVIFEKAVQAGFVSLKEDGILKVIQGQTSMDEVWKVLV